MFSEKTEIQIKTWTGNLLFEYSCQDNTIKKTLEEAVKKGANLESADLRGANLESADLRNVYLEGAILKDTNLINTNLGGAYLGNTNLENSDLRGAYLGDVILENAYLGNTNLKGAILGGADLEGAILEGANLKGAILGGINLEGVNLRNANLKGAKNYFNSLDFAIEIIGRQNSKIFTNKEWAILGQIIIKKLCWEEIKKKLGKKLLPILRKIDKAGWGEYLEYYKLCLKKKIK